MRLICCHMVEGLEKCFEQRGQTVFSPSDISEISLFWGSDIWEGEEEGSCEVGMELSG